MIDVVITTFETGVLAAGEEVTGFIELALVVVTVVIYNGYHVVPWILKSRRWHNTHQHA